LVAITSEDSSVSWVGWREQCPHWIAKQDDINAAPLCIHRNIHTNTVSVYELSDADQITPARVAAALAAKRPKPQSTGCVIVDDTAVRNLGVEIEKTPGTTIDAELNKAHRDLAKLTGKRLVDITRLLLESEFVTVTLPELEASIRAGANDGRLPPKHIASELRERLGIAL